MTVETDVLFRAFDPATDYAAAAQMITEAHLHDGIDWLPTAADLEHEWAHGGHFRPEVDARVAVREGGSAGEIVGVATTNWRKRGDKIVHNIEAWVRPAARRHGIGNALFEWAEHHEADRARDGSGGPTDLPHEVGGWADAAVAGPAQLAARRGYRVVRYGMEMVRDLAMPIPEALLPAGLEVRPVRPEDHRRIWAADTEAFRDHWESAERTEADYVWWFTRPTLDTSLWQVAWDGDEVAGSVLTSVYPEENEKLGVKRAWLEHISTGRRWRRRGLASALIASSLRLLIERGLEQAALGVDAENPSGAVRVYERMGFRRYRTGVSYRKDLDLR